MVATKISVIGDHCYIDLFHIREGIIIGHRPGDGITQGTVLGVVVGGAARNGVVRHVRSACDARIGIRQGLEQLDLLGSEIVRLGEPPAQGGSPGRRGLHGGDRQDPEAENDHGDEDLDEGKAALPRTSRTHAHMFLKLMVVTNSRW
ncbi:MAG: hypothetical protein P8Y63_15080 [Deltaproteobacteria bacterium]